MIIDGDMQCFPAGELRASATSSVAAHDDLLKTGHAFDVEVQQVTGRGVFITHRGRSWMQIAPATQPGAPQDTAYGGGAQSRGLGNLVTRTMLPAQCEDGVSEGGRRTARAMPRTRGAVQQASRALDAIAADPFGDRFRSDVEAGRGPLQRHPSHHLLHQRFSTTQSKSGILVNVHSTSPRSGLLSTISFSGSGRMDNLLKDHRYPHPRCFQKRGCKRLKTKGGSRKKRAKRRQEVERKGVERLPVCRLKVGMRTARTRRNVEEDKDAPERQALN